SPPKARQPSTSYCPATRSPGSSFGLNENRVPQLRQKPSVSPARPSWPRPTGCSQPAQKRRLSGTCGSARMALAGSRYGTGGISTSPAPSRPRAERPLVRRDPLVPRVPVVWRLPAVPDPAVPGPPDPADPPDPAEAAGAAARPQTLQYPSSMVPPQLVQVLMATPLPSSAPASCASSSVSPRTAQAAGWAPDGPARLG